MRFAVIENGRVANVIEAGEGFEPEGVLLVRDDEGAAQIGGAWTGKSFEAAPAPAMTSDEVAAARARAYAQEADPLFFKFQRGEADRDDWIAKVKEIKARFPKG